MPTDLKATAKDLTEAKILQVDRVEPGEWRIVAIAWSLGSTAAVVEFELQPVTRIGASRNARTGNIVLYEGLNPARLDELQAIFRAQDVVRLVPRPSSKANP